MVRIEDPEDPAASGRTHYDNATFTGRRDSQVSGTVFVITDAELAAADQYEKLAGYKRIAVILGSGAQAWVYVDARTAPCWGRRDREPRHSASSTRLSSPTRRSRPPTGIGRPIRRRRTASWSGCSGRLRVTCSMGAGTGDFTIGLAPRVDRLIAVEPSRAMLERGRDRVQAVSPNVEWLAVAAEEFAFGRPLSAVVAAEAFHWLDWDRVMPRIAGSLAPDRHLSWWSASSPSRHRGRRG